MPIRSFRAPRYFCIAVAAVVAVYVSAPERRVVAQGSSAGTDLLYVLAGDQNLYRVVPGESIKTLVAPLSGACYVAGGAQAWFDPAPDGTFYGFADSCVDGLYWARLDPLTGVVTLLHHAPATVSFGKFKPAFRREFGSPGEPIGYRFNSPTLNISSQVINLYAVDALSPYREHLLYSNVLPAISNRGLGTVLSPDAATLYYATASDVYRFPLPGGPMQPVMTIGSFGIDGNRGNTTGADSNNRFFLVDHRTIYARLEPESMPPVVTSSGSLDVLLTTAAFRPAPWGGVRIEPHTELVTSETGATATFTAVLTVQPTADVTLTFTSTDAGEGTVNPSSATFTTGNWNTPQTITVTGVADALIDGDQAYTITTSATSSADANYSGRAVLDVGVTNIHVNQLPALSPGTPSVRQGSPAATMTLGSASDAETAAGSLTVVTQTVPSGVTVGTITNTSGTITAPLSATCSATTGGRTLTLRVTDANGGVTDQDVTVTVLANTAPGLGTYAATTVAAGASTTVTPNAATTDNGTAGLAAAAPGFTGSLSVDSSTGVVTVGSAGPIGTHTVTITATDNCGATTTRSFDLTVVTAGTEPLVSGGTRITAAQVTDLRTRIDAVRAARGLNGFAWTDPVLVEGVTVAKAQHLIDLRTAITQAYQAASMIPPSFTDPVVVPGETMIRAVHFNELRAAVTGLES